MAREPVLAEILGRGSLRADDADLEALTRLMVVARVSAGASLKSFYLCRCSLRSLVAAACPRSTAVRTAP